MVDRKHRSVCAFCELTAEATYELRLGSMAAIRDAYPVTEGHYLIVPMRHEEDFFSLSETELLDARKVALELKRRVVASDSRVVGFNIGVNQGAAAGQTIAHVHIHLIPRRQGDTPLPRGGVRGVIPGRMGY
ncbi:MAG: HIT family protein [Dehalococcoidia bacterium]